MKMKRKVSRRIMVSLRNILCLFLMFLVFLVYKTKKKHYEQIKSQLYTSAIKYMEFKEQVYQNKLQIHNIKRFIAKNNQEEKILNRDIHGSVRPDVPVFVIFVDKYKPNLKFLVTSLHHVAGITDALVIFSHSYFDENVNSLVKSIDFTRVLQIFYPYSVQIYPKEFPGNKADDCKHDTNKDTATESNGTGAKLGDYTRSRDTVLAQNKHFWWWTINHVFKKISHTKNHKGIFIFLDDDVFLMQDFIYMTLHMKQICKFINECDFVALHTSEKPDFYETKTDGANIKTWDPNLHSSVLAFDSRVWKIIAAHDYLFCNYDDYSWARTLLHLSLNRIDGIRFKVISSVMPRAFKTSSNPDVSGPFVEYNIVSTVHNSLQMQKRNRGNFYPLQLEIFLDIELDGDDLESVRHIDNNSGYWSDPRDKSLCIKISGR